MVCFVNKGILKGSRRIKEKKFGLGFLVILMLFGATIFAWFGS